MRHAAASLSFLLPLSLLSIACNRFCPSTVLHSHFAIFALSFICFCQFFRFASPCFACDLRTLSHFAKKNEFSNKYSDLMWKQ
jgi:hypothetical protein